MMFDRFLAKIFGAPEQVDSAADQISVQQEPLKDADKLVRDELALVFDDYPLLDPYRSSSDGNPVR